MVSPEEIPSNSSSGTNPVLRHRCCIHRDFTHMMKNWIRRGTKLGLMSGSLLGLFLMTAAQALALTQQQILEKLTPIPVFAILDDNGAPLVASVEDSDGDEVPVAGVFIERQDAEAFVDGLRQNDPSLGSRVQVVPASMGEVYELVERTRAAEESPEFAFVPTATQTAVALSLVNDVNEQAGQPPIETFNGVPLFAAKAGSESDYLTIQREDEQIIPLFFEHGDLQSFVEQFKTQNPELADTVTIEAYPLEIVLDTFKTSNNPELEQIELVPSSASRAFIRSLRDSENQ